MQFQLIFNTFWVCLGLACTWFGSVWVSLAHGLFGSVWVCLGLVCLHGLSACMHHTLHGLSACMVFCVMAYEAQGNHELLCCLLHFAQHNMSFDGSQESKDERAKANPMVMVVDIERAINKFFEIQGFRGFDAVVDSILASGATWTAGAKVFNFTAWSVHLTCFQNHVSCNVIWVFMLSACMVFIFNMLALGNVLGLGECVNKMSQQNVSTTCGHKMRQQNVSAKCVNKMCQQYVSTKCVNKMCQQNVSIQYVNKMCQQNVSAKGVNTSCQQNVSTKRVDKMCQQNVHPCICKWYSCMCVWGPGRMESKLSK
jgi:hypothetical protein